MNSIKRRFQSEKDSKNVHKIVIKSKRDFSNKITMNFENLKLKTEENFEYLKNYTTFQNYFQSKVLHYNPVFTSNYKIY